MQTLVRRATGQSCRPSWCFHRPLLVPCVVRSSSSARRGLVALVVCLSPRLRFGDRGRVCGRIPSTSLAGARNSKFNSRATNRYAQ
eukprot:429747-Prymnesium_polylepis.1